MIVHKPECQMQRDNVLPCSCGAVWTAAMLLAQERPVSSQLQRIENGLQGIARKAIQTDILDRIAVLESKIDQFYNLLMARMSIIDGSQDKLMQSHAALEQQIEKLGTKLTSWLAEEAIAADILKKTRELQQDAKHNHTPAMRARAALRLAKRRTSTNRGSK